MRQTHAIRTSTLSTIGVVISTLGAFELVQPLLDRLVPPWSPRLARWSPIGAGLQIGLGLLICWWAARRMRQTPTPRRAPISAESEVDYAHLRSRVNQRVRLRFVDGEQVDAVLLAVEPLRDRDLTYEVIRPLQPHEAPHGQAGGTYVAQLADLVSWEPLA